MRLNLFDRSYFVTIAPSRDGRDRWMIGRGNRIWRAWSMPRWASFKGGRRA